MYDLIITCEHAYNKVPTLVRKQFEGCTELLNSHRGYDIGALALVRSIAKRFKVEPILGQVSRLVVDLNRSIGHKSLFYDTIGKLPKAVLDDILTLYYFPYREEVRRRIAQSIRKRPVVHLSIHSFTPVFNGYRRKVDLGLLYDPKRGMEVRYCKQLQEAFRSRSDAICYMNHPYRGTSDGLVTALRKQFPEDRYAGIEIEMNQRFALYDRGMYGKKFLEPLLDSLAQLHTGG